MDFHLFIKKPHQYIHYTTEPHAEDIPITRLSPEALIQIDI